MQKLIFPIFLFFLGALLQTSTMQERISSQNLSNRIYKNIDLTLINYIQFDTLSVGLFRPTFCLTNKKGELFILDYSDLTIHAFKFSKDYKKYSHRKFGKGKGKGPGELINPTDFKTYNDTLYIVDPFKGTIEVYYNDFFWKSIKLEKSEIPERIVVSEKHFLIKPQYSKNGIEIIKYDRNGIIQDRFRLSDLIKIDLTTQYYNTDLFQDNSSNLFYILPKATGYLATFDENGINKIKYTIDGPKAQTIKKRKITENFIGNKIVIDYYTISNVGVGENYILVKAKDVKNDKRFYDIYTKVDFNYKFSAKEFPYYNYIWIDKNIIFCVDDYGLKILKLKSKFL